MSVSTDPKHQRDPDPAPGVSFALSGQELTLMAPFIADLATARGVNASGLVERLKAGSSVGAALGVPDRMVEFLYERAHKWFSASRFERSESVFRALCILRPACADYWAGLGVCLRRREAWDDAIAALDMAGRLRPDWALPCFHVLELYMRRGMWDHATTALMRLEAAQGSPLPAALAAEVPRFRVALERRGAVTAVPGSRRGPAANKPLSSTRER